MLGDKALEFFSDRKVEDNITIPWSQIKYVEGVVTHNKKIGRRFAVVLNNNSKISFSSKESGKILKLIREEIGDDKVIKAPTFTGTIAKVFKKNR